MAKRRQLPTIDQIESKLGYKLDYLDNVDDDIPTFYSDLTPVPNSAYERALREFDVARKQELKGADSSHGLPILGAPKTSSIFFRLPRELRDRIYMFSIPSCEWTLGDVDQFNSTTFAGALGDPTGFFFPLNKDLSVLLVNKQIRQEALPIAYRKTFFRLDDIDDFIKVIISIGQIGRANIESVEFSWESRSDLSYQMGKYLESDDNNSHLPALHVLRCVQLLKECRRLAFLRLYFEPDLISNMSIASFQADPGIRELSSVRGIRRVEIGTAVFEPLDHYDFIKWLKGKMESGSNT
ncbi:hypothetical protein TSTA_022650 [Talaromyces stipitatus ATCC 10500]|uniref:Uncharacterized protein n=1 Tax=Talaromyces stipitatus (strain ATCC 10500 / CBS 375.48 / QM 6759 / NRRL 1006) TaxID=441959 RepID=B8MI49_TALSN|nr:uncharacterized protein TSTA_022650 [Talaromyces stipitatus ATCC 10500]EED17211.1 hypothetical protein TSTA_022650 [Talaromyces stipitatus ATCC 10500]